MLFEYLPILIFLFIALIFASVMMTAGFFFGGSNPDSEKNSPYECGFEAFEDSRMKFDVRFYLVAILFIIFDLEIAFLFPWAVVLDHIGHEGFFGGHQQHGSMYSHGHVRSKFISAGHS